MASQRAGADDSPQHAFCDVASAKHRDAAPNGPLRRIRRLFLSAGTLAINTAADLHHLPSLTELTMRIRILLHGWRLKADSKAIDFVFSELRNRDWRCWLYL
jgi:hypothetical protein